MHVTLARPLCLLFAALSAAGPALADDTAAYTEKVQPILRARCFACHGPLKQEGGLRLDTGEAIVRGGDSGPAVELGKSGDSRIVERISSSDEATRMPQEGAALSTEEIDAIRAWIDAGATYPDEPPPADPFRHWSFVPPTKPNLPGDASDSNPIDRFIAAKHAELGLRPVAPADKYTLLRRLSIDLVGLPPTRDELVLYITDESPNAYEKLVDRLLASPQYGERWGRHWMDVWRYSDWDGFGAEVRDSQPHLWRWRDWIVESLNADKPYAEMIVQMLAADELAPGDMSAARATGFLARNYYKFSRHTWLDNAVEHTGKAFLGLTFNCARCHDHKYDPIAHKEYYQLRAIFEPYNVRFDPVPGEIDPTKNGLTRIYDATPDAKTFLFKRGNEKEPDEEQPISATAPRLLGGGPLTVAPIELPPIAWYPGSQAFAHADQIAAKQQVVSQTEAALHKADDALKADTVTGSSVAPTPEKPPASATALARAREIAAASLAVARDELAFVTARATSDAARYAVPPANDSTELIKTTVKTERQFRLSSARHALLAAQHARLAAVESKATAEALANLDPPIATAQQALAAAEAAANNCDGDYTALGAVYPKQSTGRRLAWARKVADPGNPLTARVAVNHIWQRHFGVPLVPTVFDFGHNGKPPVNQALLDWLAMELVESGWRMKHVHRLIVTSRAYQRASSEGAEAAANRSIDRDNLYLWRANPKRLEAEAVRDAVLLADGRLELTAGGPDLDPAADADVPRRSLYFRHSKEKRVPMLAIFDQANVTECYRRIETVVPHQALAMANSPLTAKAAERIAKRVTDLVGSEATANERFVDEAFLLVLSRPCTTQERQLCVDYMNNPMANVLAKADAGADVAQSAAARESVVHALLNHHDFVTAR